MELRLTRDERAVLVRRAREDDAEFVIALASRFAETRPAWRGEREVTDGTARVLARAFASADSGAAMFVAEAGGDRLGFAYAVSHEDFFTGERHGHLSELAVVRDGSGAAAPLVEAVESFFRGLGVRFVTLNTNVANARAREIYERLGYAQQVVQLVKVL